MSFMKKAGDGFVEPSPGPEAHYPFAGNADDISGNSHHLTVSGASLTTGRKGAANHAYNFNGTSDFINSTVLVTPMKTSTGTFSVWLKPDNFLVGGTERIIGFYDESTDRLITMHMSSGRLFATNWEAGFNWATSTDGTVFSEDTWTHVGLVALSNDFILYAGGVAVAQSFSNEADKNEWIDTLAGVDLARLGSRKWNNAAEDQLYAGDMDDIRFYTRALSAAEMAMLASE